MEIVRLRQARGMLSGGVSGLQKITNLAMMQSFSETISMLKKIVNQGEVSTETDGVPVYLFGNVFPDPEGFDLLVSSGIHVVGDDLCTGRRSFQFIETCEDEDPFMCLARSILIQEPCARTMDVPEPYPLGKSVAARARACGARGVIAHVAKFCDPYLSRMPWVKDELDASGLPLLTLEGDCTLRSLGQHQTRLQAFAEMLR